MDELHSGNIRKAPFCFCFVILRIFIFLPTCSESGITENISCPSMCVCEGSRMEGVEVDCIAKNLTTIPQDLDENTVKL